MFKLQLTVMVESIEQFGGKEQFKLVSQFLFVLQMLLSYSKLRGVAVGQTGYQGVASCCNNRRDGLALLDEIKVWLGYG